MNKETILAYDLGTGSIKASLYNVNAENLASAVVQYPTAYPESGIHEQCPEDWQKALCEVTELLLSGMQNRPEINGIGISGHSLGVVAIDRDNNLLTDRTPIWSDTRAKGCADEFFDKTDYRSWYETTGCGFPAHLYSVFKIMWYRNFMPHVYNRAKAFIGTKDYLNLFLTGAVVTDYSYASGSGVYDLSGHHYRNDFISAAELSAEKFPDIVKSSEIIGSLTEKAAAALNLRAGIPVVCGGVDNACMSLGAGCVSNNDMYASLGSSAWIAASVDKPVVDFDKKLYTWEHCVPGLYLPSAGVFSSGTALDWVIKNMFGELMTGDDMYKRFDEIASSSPPGANGVLFCPVMAGGSAVDASTNMKGALCNFDLSSTKADVARAVLEGIAYDLSLALDAIGSQIQGSDRLLVVGGGSKSPLWRQIYADILKKTVVFSSVARDAAALGAAALALKGTGVWNSFEKIKEIHSKGSEQNYIKENNMLYKKQKKYFTLICSQQAELYRAMH